MWRRVATPLWRNASRGLPAGISSVALRGARRGPSTPAAPPTAAAAAVRATALPGGAAASGAAATAAAAPTKNATAAPAVAAAVDPAALEGPAHLRREYAQLSTDEIIRRLSAFSRHRRPPSAQLPMLVALLAEIAATRAALLTPKVLREVLTVAAAAGQHEIALRVYYGRCATHAMELDFSLLDSVVDSAYSLASPQHLRQLAVIGTNKMRNVPLEVLSDVALARLFWRVACLAVEGTLARDAALALFRDVWTNVLVPVHPALAPSDPDAAFAALCRRVRYSFATDKGEMHCFAYMRERGVMRCTTVDLLARERVVILFVALIRSCRAGSWVDQADEYFALCRAGRDEQGIEEQLVYGYFAILQSAKEHGRLARTGAELLERDPAGLSAGLVVMIAHSASEAAMTPLVLAAYNALVRLRTGPDVTPFVVHQLLSALGKVAAADFPALVRECVDKGLATLTPESAAFLSLQHALNSPKIVDELAAVVADMDAKGVALSDRTASQLLLAYLRLESPLFLPTYRKAVDDLGLFRPQWLEHLVLWADRLRYALSSEDRAYVVRSIRARAGPGGPLGQRAQRGGGAASGPGPLDGVRPAVALLLRDEAAAVAAAGGAAAAAAAEAAAVPLLLDPRSYFLRRARPSLSLVPSPCRVVGVAGAVAADRAPLQRLLPPTQGHASARLVADACVAAAGSGDGTAANAAAPSVRFFELYLLEVLRDMQQTAPQQQRQQQQQCSGTPPPAFGRNVACNYSAW